jgi:signal transduction histidine kinase
VNYRHLILSTTFRLAALAAPLYLLAGWALLGFVYFNTVTIMDRRVDTGLAAESERFRDEGLLTSRDRLLAALRSRIDEERGSSRLYRLDAPDGAILVTNFLLAQGEVPAGGQYVHATMRANGAKDEAAARLHAVRLDDGSRLILGRDLTEEDRLRTVIGESVYLAAAFTALLALGAGLITSRAVTRRLAGFNASADRLLHGHVNERLPVDGSGDEFDRLARNLNKALAQIEELMETTRNVTNNIAHDLRGPLTHVRNRLELLRISASDAQEEEIAQCGREIDRLLETFEALLTIARVEHGATLAFSEVDLGVLVDDVADYFSPLAEERGIELVVERRDPSKVFGDRHLLFQALSNVVDNALRYTVEGGRIVVAAGRLGESGVLSVADNGPGIPEGERGKVLKRFVRLSTSRQEPGSGLGLAVVDAIVRHHHGSLALSDNSPGLLVTITLPYAAH